MPTSATTGLSGHRGTVFVGQTVLRAHHWIVTVTAQEQELTVVPARRGSRPYRIVDPITGEEVGRVPHDPDPVIERQAWCQSFVLGVPRAEAQIEAYYVPEDNPFNLTRPNIRVGRIIPVTLYPNFDDLTIYWRLDILVSRVEQATSVRSAQTYTFSGPVLARVDYPQQ